ncbi:hypothetical protein VOLCADRAFT_96137 [Volvox carteri f. nagariensis]|uniref:Uncharacterized protein n=1 Tax=Volvox carteri f. nagariensis TaxID=3068 RepID=D8U9B1_VOLCA|nr:uncharacterized protein VOLCADRAFT_96137 [Volvox carteri f. nagariensis]EFJ43776.1 hypothetical protein VOLCADRAFT_96137 [Volvox carteri f. nagariensis]|eukprot:XP_002955257.1 hypothetical protein VOLCADRAFT_96137 [Volvox carteri f. nagariensis]
MLPKSLLHIVEVYLVAVPCKPKCKESNPETRFVDTEETFQFLFFTSPLAAAAAPPLQHRIRNKPCHRMVSWVAAAAARGRGRRGQLSRRAAPSLALLLAVITGHMSQVALGQTMLLPGMGQWAQNVQNIGQQGRDALMGAMPNWGGLSLGGGLNAFNNPFMFGGGMGPLGNLFQTRDGSEYDTSVVDPNYGQPFGQPSVADQARQGLQSALSWAPRSSAEKEKKIKELQAALKGDAAIAAIVGPSLLLASSILITVSTSLSTASTSVGIAGALAGNLVGWSKWINNAEVFFLKLRSGGKHRSLLEVAGNNTDADGPEAGRYRAQLLDQLRSANDVMSAWGHQLQRARNTVQDASFLDFLRSQQSALETARKALGAVQAHPLGAALDLRSASPMGGLLHSFRGSGDDGDGAHGAGGLLGGSPIAEQIAKVVNNARNG